MARGVARRGAAPGTPAYRALLRVNASERVRFWKIEIREFFNVRRDILARARRIGFFFLSDYAAAHTSDDPSFSPAATSQGRLNDEFVYYQTSLDFYLSLLLSAMR